MKTDFYDPKYYVNREISWVQFDHRVLNEAKNKRQPLFERLKFMSIVSSNLDGQGCVTYRYDTRRL